jgi:hypothetical protein
MAVQDTEKTLDAVKAELEADLPAKVAAINTEAADGIEISEPVEVRISTRGELVDFPLIMVLPATSKPGKAGDTGGRIFKDHRVRIVVWEEDADEDVLARKLLRQMRAVNEVVMNGRKITNAGYGIVWLEDDYGPVFRPNPEGHYYQAVRSDFLIPQQRDY